MGKIARKKIAFSINFREFLPIRREPALTLAWG